MKRLTLIAAAAATLAAAFSVRAADAYWKQGGTGPFTDPSHWKDGNVPKAGNSVSFQWTTDAVVDDDAMALFVSFSSIQLQGTATRLTINNTTNVTIRKGHAWFVSDGIVKKIGAGTLTLDHALDPVMISVYGGFEVHEGTLAFVSGSESVAPACPIGVFSEGMLQLPSDYDVVLLGLYGDGHVKNPTEVNVRVTGGKRENPSEFSGTFENTPVKYFGIGGYQRFLNSAVTISGYQYSGYLGTAVFPTCLFRGCCEYEYLGSGETTATSKLFMNNVAYRLVMNGGTNGVLNLARDIYYNAEDSAGIQTYVGEVVWTGDGIQTNIYSGACSTTKSRPVYWKKTGTGSWRFVSGSTRSGVGVVATEKGRLEYDDMAEAGSASPLGSASNLLSEYYGAPVDESKRVSYAYLIGDGTNDITATTATMAYIGETEKTIKTRLVAVKGAGRFESTTASLDWTGFTSATAGTNTLVLAGAATGCVARAVTNGVGKVVVVKEGTGDWTVDGNYDFSSGVEARQGTLTLNSDKQYTWYRLQLFHTNTLCWVDQLILVNEKNENQIYGLQHNLSADGNITALGKGECAFGRTGFAYAGGKAAEYNLTNLFTDVNCFGGTFGGSPTVGSYYVIPIVFRLPEGADDVVRYDIKSRGKASWLPERDPSAWTLEGSRDGINWELLDSQSDVSHTTVEHRWFSSNTSDFTTGYGPFAGEATLTRPASIDYVAVARGATLRSTAPQTVTGIRYDAALGGGTLDGFAFAANGTIEVANFVRGSWTLQLTTRNCTGSIDGWKVVVNGREKPAYGVKLTSAGIVLTPPGLIWMVR